MEKTKKRLISTAVVTAIILAVVVCGLVFGRNGNAADDTAFFGAQSDGTITGVYNELEDKTAYFNNLVSQGYNAVNSQTDFDNYFNTNAEINGGRYALNPAVSFTAKNAKYIKNAEIDGCGASVTVSINIDEAFGDGSLYSSSSTTGIDEFGFGANTMFYYAPRAGSESVRIKPHGGFADYAVNVTVKNVEFSMTGGSDTEVSKSDYGSVLIGGVFGIASGSTINNCSFSYDAKINVSNTLSSIGHAFDYRIDYRSRPYDLTLSFGMLTGYLYESSVSDCNFNMSSTSSIRLKTNGVNDGPWTGNQGTPRSITGGLIGIAQNNNTIKNIAVSGGGSLTADPGSTYWNTEGSAKIGIAGALVGAVADGENQADEYMLKAEGNTHIYNIVSTWSGSVTMWGIVSGSLNYTISGVTGTLVGIKGKYSYGEGEAASAPNSAYLHGIYKLYSGDAQPAGNAVSYSYVRDASDSNVNYSAAGIEFSNVRITEDGQEWLGITGDKKVDIAFNEEGLTITYDVSSPEYTSSRAMLWESTEYVISGDQVTDTTTEAWLKKNVDGSEQIISSYDDAVKTYSVTISNSSVVNRRYDFVTGYATYYKVSGEERFDYADSLRGSIGTRTYDVITREYNGNVLTAPVVQLYLSSDYSGSPVVDSSSESSQWIIQKNGSGSYISVGDNQTKSVNVWYMSLRNNEDESVGYLYKASSDGKNYIAYKDDNALASQESSLNGTPVTTRYYVYTIVPKVVTPAIVDKTTEELIYDNAAKIYAVDFNGQIYSGDMVTPTLLYYSLDGETESSVESAVNAGSYRVRLTAIDNGNYALSSDQIFKDFTITKRVLESDIDESTTEFVYNGNVQTPVVNISNQISGVDQSAVVSISYKKDGVNATSKNVGEYMVVVDLTTNAKSNYDLIGDKELTYNITPATLEYSGVEEYSFVYDSLGVNYDKLAGLTVNPINVGNAATGDPQVEYDVYFRPYAEGDDSMDGYDPSAIFNAGVYDCMIYAEVSNYNVFSHKIKLTITPAPVTFSIARESGTPNDDGNYDYNGKEVSFTAHYSGIGSVDTRYISFETKIYPATNESGEWKIVDGSEGVSSVINAGNYIVRIEQTKGADIDANANYDTVSDPGTRELPFTINKATLVWQFSGEGLNYHEDSGEYYAEYNGQTYTLALEGGDLDSQLVEGDKGKYTLTGNVEYFLDTQEGAHSVGTAGVRNAGTYIVAPEVEFADGTPDLTVNYEIKGGEIVITQRPVTIVVKDVEIPYGTDLYSLGEETFAAMWSYAENSNQFLEEDGQVLTFAWLESMPDRPVRGSYPFEFIPSLVNENSGNYEITAVYTSGDNSICKITGLALELEVVVTDNGGIEVASFTVEEGRTEVNANAVYYGGEYAVTVRATNLIDGNPGIGWQTDGYKFTNVADSTTVTFTLTGEANQVYYIGQDLSEEGGSDGVLSVTFTVDKRTVTVTPNDVEVEYGMTFTPAGSTVGGDGFVDGEQDWFTYSYNADTLGAEIGSVADITVTAQVKAEHTGAENNYNFEYKTGVATRVPRELNVTLENKEKIYGSTLTVGADDYSFADGESIVEGDDLELAYAVVVEGETIADAANIGVGEYALTLTSGNGNYSLVVAEGATLTVNPKTANVTLESVTTEYDAQAHPITVVQIDGLIPGDESVTAVVRYLLDSQAIDGEPVNRGVYTADVTGFSSPNYTVGEVTGGKTVEITNVTVNVTVCDAVTAYGTGKIVPADGAAFFTSDSELFDADALDPSYVYNDGQGDVTALAIGSYENSLGLDFNGEAAQNYAITFTNKAKLTVEKANLAEVASLDEVSGVYDGSEKTITVLGVQTEQVNIGVTKDGAAVESVVDAGEYIVTVTANSGNYEGTATLTYTVDKAVFDGTLSSVSSVYNGSAVDLAGLVDDKYGDVAFAITLGGETVTEVKNAGVYTVVITAGENSNYTGSVDVTYTVNKATAKTPTRSDLTITAVWNGFTITDKNGVHTVLVTLTEGDWDGATDSITGLKPETEYTVYVKFAADDNYNESGVASMTVTTGKKVAAVLDPSDVTYTVYYNRIEVSVDGDGDYAYSKDGGKTWQDGNILSGLEENTEYSISVKIKESASSGESNVVTVKKTTGSDPAAFNNALNGFGDTVTAADLDKYDDMMDAYGTLADGDKAAVDTAKLEKLQASYNALIAEVNGDVIAAQNVARKAAGKGAAAAAASVLAAVAAAIVAKKKFVF